jgi:hypothetical protein
MPLTIKKYSMYCLDEQNTVTVWSENLPTKCPNNDSHLIDENSIGVLDTMNMQSVYIQGKSFGSNVQGFYMYQGTTIHINVGPQTIQDVTFPINSSIYGLTFVSSEEHRGDFIDIIAYPSTPCGVLTAQSNPGDTILQVDANVLNNMKVGFYATLNTSTKTCDLGLVKEINPISGTITVTNPIDTVYPPWISFFELSVYVVKNYSITEPGIKHKLGYGSSGNQIAQSNSIFRMVYYNNNGIAKSLSYAFEYFY